MLFTVGESGDTPSPRLYVMDADGKNLRLRLNWVWDASFSPNGRSIACTSRTSPSQIWVAATDGHGKGRLLARNGLSVDWSPKGDAIAFERYVGHAACSATSGSKVSTAEPYGAWFGTAVSPTGRRTVAIAFVRDRRRCCGHGDIWVVGLAGKAPHRVIRNGDYPR